MANKKQFPMDMQWNNWEKAYFALAREFREVLLDGCYKNQAFNKNEDLGKEKVDSNFKPKAEYWQRKVVYHNQVTSKMENVCFGWN